MSETPADDRAVPDEDRLAFAAYAAFAAFRTVSLQATKLHWKFAPPQDKDCWRRAAAAVVAEMKA